MFSVLRLLAGALLLGVGLLLGTTVIAASGAPPQRVPFLVAGACYALGLLAAHAALRWRAAHDRVTVRRRVVFPLGFAAAAEAFMLSALPWPPTRAELAAFAPLAAVLLLTAVSLVLAIGERPGVRWSLLALALWAAFVIGRFFWQFPAPGAWGAGPAFVLSALLAFSTDLALIAAYWAARPLWRTPRRAGAAA